MASTSRPFIIIKTGSTFEDYAAQRGDFEDWIISGLGVSQARIFTVDVTRGESLPTPQSIRGAVVTGSHDMVTDRAPWSERTGAWLSSAVSARTPILGICYGHQLLAHALGGVVGDIPSEREIGTLDITLTEAAISDPLFRSMESPFQAQVSHSQSVLTLPSGATLLGRSFLDPHQAFVIGGCAWGVQFHPEFNAEVTRTYIERRADDIRSMGLDPEMLSAGCHNTPQAASLLERFAKLF